MYPGPNVYLSPSEKGKIKCYVNLINFSIPESLMLLLLTI